MIANRHRGLHAIMCRSNTEEQRFADAWANQNESGKTLSHLLNTKFTGMPPDPSDRDCEVAATVIQWLGSPVGQHWLKEMGYEKRKP